ncbi:MAG: hypothetical protein QF886_15060, partial [Planctomycetota bacterium]|nr:hypothetical protein [Planctomycetota bacterium]
RMLQGGAFGDLWAVEARVLTSQLRYRRPDTSWLFRSEYAGSGILSWLYLAHCRTDRWCGICGGEVLKD